MLPVLDFIPNKFDRLCNEGEDYNCYDISLKIIRNDPGNLSKCTTENTGWSIWMLSLFGLKYILRIYRLITLHLSRNDDLQHVEFIEREQNRITHFERLRLNPFISFCIIYGWILLST